MSTFTKNAYLPHMKLFKAMFQSRIVIWVTMLFHEQQLSIIQTQMKFFLLFFFAMRFANLNLY